MDESVRKSNDHGIFRVKTIKISFLHLPTRRNPRNNDSISSNECIRTQETLCEKN
jgi:hypothetical protein